MYGFCPKCILYYYYYYYFDVSNTAIEFSRSLTPNLNTNLLQTPLSKHPAPVKCGISDRTRLSNSTKKEYVGSGIHIKNESFICRGLSQFSLGNSFWIHPLVELLLCIFGAWYPVSLCIFGCRYPVSFFGGVRGQ